MSVCPGGVVVSQHALQVVSQHALQQVSWGVVSQHSIAGGIPACLAGLQRGGGSRPTPSGGLQAHTWGASRPTPGGIPACTEADHPPHGWLLSRAVRILLECILVVKLFTWCDCDLYVYVSRYVCNLESHITIAHHNCTEWMWNLFMCNIPHKNTSESHHLNSIINIHTTYCMQ